MAKAVQTAISAIRTAKEARSFHHQVISEAVDQQRKQRIEADLRRDRPAERVIAEEVILQRDPGLHQSEIGEEPFRIVGDRRSPEERDEERQREDVYGPDACKACEPEASD
jgi:hypothetical protein